MDQIIKKGKLIAIAKESKNRNKYIKWNYYVTPIYINGNPYIIQFDTVYRIDNNNENHFRVARVYSFEEIQNRLF